MDPQFERIRRTISKLVDGTIGTYEWDDNMHSKMDDRKNKQAEALRRIAWDVSRLFPPPAKGASKGYWYTSEKGLELFKCLLNLTQDQIGG